METREMIPVHGQASSDLVNLNEMNTIVEMLNGLIADNRGIMQIYETAVNQLETAANVELLQRYAAQHHSYISELSNMVVSYAGTPTTSSNGSSFLKQIWVRLKAAVTEGDGSIMSEVAQGAENILETYGEAMNTTMPDAVRNMVRRQMSEIRVTSNKLSALDAVYNS